MLRRFAAEPGLPALMRRVTSDVVGAEGGGARSVRPPLPPLLLLALVLVLSALLPLLAGMALLLLLLLVPPAPAAPQTFGLITGPGTVTALTLAFEVSLLQLFAVVEVVVAGAMPAVAVLTGLHALPSPLSRLLRLLGCGCTELDRPRAETTTAAVLSTAPPLPL